ncbi:myo-inositol-1(or 4)-monophosphatase [Humidesulfovibrio mexicanus]|uniref:Inositol-1-monophosphatase n=1 Tax=Humidesulfovibrio mexicanus TaxID=147047 RepID=A0A238XJF3_9BACT|nr:inositol monophosphatase family protein [Humidesulfovibrio mexicanus]SNR59125.1 myo-inositol-1(or 4)-monophosphatase [Humidesulfovibrio mexicanus]
MKMHSSLHALLPAVESAVRAAGELVREHDKRPRRIRCKSSMKDLVTETDGAVESLLRRSLSSIVPEARFLGEEGSPDAGLGGLAWVVDPLDGTTNFAHGVPFVATSVALCLEGGPLLGVVNLPLLGELFSAVKDAGASLNGSPMRVSGVSAMEAALVSTGFPYRIEDHKEAILRQLSKALPETQGVRRAGSAALDLAYVACGRYDGFFEFALNPWDTAAGVLLVAEAGGRVGTMMGSLPYRLGGPDILATNGDLFEPLQRMLKAASATTL